MRYLWYTNYQKGHSGLSNGIMSIEVGVILAFLSNRFLILEGNISPPANIVAYDGRVDNQSPSRISDLIDIPVPWGEPGDVDIDGLRGRELTDQHLAQSMYYVPGTVDIHSSDAKGFANGRTHWLCETDELAETPLLMCTEEPMVPADARHRDNLSFYSYFFYLDQATRRAVYQMLERMKPRSPYADLAQRVAADLGAFNAVHMRRGDFKVTYGVTILDRQPWEAIEAFDNHFSRSNRLVILTDERDDPFFDEIKAAYGDHVFIDHHILDNYEEEFLALPHHDSIALAYLSQLVAAESQDFIGTMTSTFTSIVQRYRGNRGKEEPFKFLWNELPTPGDRLERGRHPVSDCVPLDRGIMVEERDGPYSWNRYNKLINPAWMREWPESFLTFDSRQSETSRRQRVHGGFPTGKQAHSGTAIVHFDGFQVAVKTEIEGLALRLREYFGSHRRKANNIIDHLSIHRAGDIFSISRGEQMLMEGTFRAGDALRFYEITCSLVELLVAKLAQARKHFTWLRGMAFGRHGRAVVVCGDAGERGMAIPNALCSEGWELLADQVIPIRQNDESAAPEIVPLVRCLWPEGAAARASFESVPLGAFVFSEHHLHRRLSFSRLSPAVCAADLTRYSIDFKIERPPAVKRICTLGEQIPGFQLTFPEAETVPAKLQSVADLVQPGSEVQGNA